jgi:hypothetical protein
MDSALGDARMPPEEPNLLETAKAGLLIASSWVALGCYAASLTTLALERCPSPLPRRLWSLGCLSYVAHMILAFEVAYDWSHANAVADIAVQSESISGVRASWGIWINYAYGLVWLADLGIWWRLGEIGYRNRPRWTHWAVHGFFLFMLFNGGFIFVERWTRWIGLSLFSVSLWAACQVAKRPKPWTLPPQKSSS